MRRGGPVGGTSNGGGGGSGITALTGDVTASGSGSVAATVVAVNGTTVPAGGGLTIGQVLRATGAGSSAWGAINLALAAAVTGLLPSVNQAPQTMTGDVTGTTAASVVTKVNGATVPAAGALTTGNAAYVSGASALTYSALNLSGGAGWVTGTLPVANGGTGATSVTNGQIFYGAAGVFAQSASLAWTAASQLLGIGSTAAAAGIAFGAAVTGVTVSQTAQASTSAGSGAAGVTTTISAQAGQAATGAANNGGAGANLVLASGAGGTSGSATAGAPGALVGQVGGTAVLQIGQTTTDFIALGASSAGSLVAQSALARFPYLGTSLVIAAYRNSGNTADLPLLTLSNATFGAGTLTFGNSTSGQSVVQAGTSYIGVVSGTLRLDTITVLQPQTAATFAITPASRATGTPVTINAGQSTTAGTAGGALSLNGAIGTGGASLSAAGGAASLVGAAGVVATSGTVAGAVGGAANVTSGAGAAGLGGTSAGGAGGNIVVNTGAGGAAAGAGTAGLAGVIQLQNASTTVLSVGSGGVGLTPASSSVAITGGTTTLSAAQYLTPIVRLSGTLVSAETVVFPNSAGIWFVDVSALLGIGVTNTLTFQSGSATTTPLSSIAATSSIYMISTYGGNTISLNT